MLGRRQIPDSPPAHNVREPLNGQAPRRPARSLPDDRNGPGAFLDVRCFEQEAADSYPNFRQVAMMAVEPRKDRNDG